MGESDLYSTLLIDSFFDKIVQGRQKHIAKSLWILNSIIASLTKFENSNYLQQKCGTSLTGTIYSS